MTTFAASIQPVSQDFFDALCAAFPPHIPVPNMSTMDDVMFSAGHQEVIEWIKAKAIRHSVVTSNVQVDVARSVDVRKT